MLHMSTRYLYHSKKKNSTRFDLHPSWMAKSESPVGRLSHDSAFIVEFQHPPLRQAPRGVVLMRPGSLADFEWLMADFFFGNTVVDCWRKYGYCGIVFSYG